MAAAAAASPAPARPPRPLAPSAAVVAAAYALRVRDHGADVEDGAPSSHVSLSLPITLHALALLWPLWSSPSPSPLPSFPSRGRRRAPAPGRPRGARLGRLCRVGPPVPRRPHARRPVHGRRARTPVSGRVARPRRGRLAAVGARGRRRRPLVLLSCGSQRQQQQRRRRAPRGDGPGAPRDAHAPGPHAPDGVLQLLDGFRRRRAGGHAGRVSVCAAAAAAGGRRLGRRRRRRRRWQHGGGRRPLLSQSDPRSRGSPGDARGRQVRAPGRVPAPAGPRAVAPAVAVAAAAGGRRAGRLCRRHAQAGGAAASRRRRRRGGVLAPAVPARQRRRLRRGRGGAPRLLHGCRVRGGGVARGPVAVGAKGGAAAAVWGVRRRLVGRQVGRRSPSLTVVVSVALFVPLS